jgi:capsular exopolysaccharide synthesis family protein
VSPSPSLLTDRMPAEDLRSAYRIHSPLSRPPYSSSAAWLQPAEEQEGLSRYVETVRERFWVILAAVVVTTGIAILYVLTATKTYVATSDMLITPITGDDPVLTSLGLLRESSDPTRDVQTASQLIANIDVAKRAGENLETDESPEALLAGVTAEPVANSNIVAVAASETSPEYAAEVANAFAKAAVDERTARMHDQIAARLPRLEAIANADPNVEGVTETAGVSVAAQIAELQTLQSGPDPTMRVQTSASAPASPSSPKKTLSVIAGLIAGLILGIGGAFALQVLDPRLRRESQLRRLYRLPVLARIPKAPRSRSNRPLPPGRTSPFISEAYRTLRATLAGPAGREEDSGHGRVILITGSSPSEGKTTSAVNLAASLALLGKRVVLIESDLRRPVLGRLLGASPEKGGVVSVLIGKSELPDALVQTDTYGSNLQLLLAEPDYREGWITDLFSTPAAAEMISTAREIADFVIIDSPPINEVVDALPLAIAADDVLLVVRLGHSRLDKLRELGELLAENDVSPTGFIIVGTQRPAKGQYHYASRGADSGGRDELTSGTRLESPR